MIFHSYICLSFLECLFKSIITEWAYNMVVLPSVSEAVGSIPSTAKIEIKR